MLEPDRAVQVCLWFCTARPVSTKRHLGNRRCAHTTSTSEPTSAPTWIASNAPSLSCKSPVTGAARQQSDVLPLRAAGPSEPSCLSIRRDARQWHSFRLLTSTRLGALQELTTDAMVAAARRAETRWVARIIPLVLAGCAGFATYVVTKRICGNALSHPDGLGALID